MNKLVYWRRELPPLADEVQGGEDVVDARSAAVPLSTADHDHLFGLCYPGLMAAATERVAQEVRRRGGSCAHVIDESIEPRIDYATGEYCLTGRFTYLLYVKGAVQPHA